MEERLVEMWQQHNLYNADIMLIELHSNISVSIECITSENKWQLNIIVCAIL